MVAFVLVVPRCVCLVGWVGVGVREGEQRAKEVGQDV